MENQDYSKQEINGETNVWVSYGMYRFTFTISNDGEGKVG